jgi:glycosyltransferase involved in cell wall biosynthesis
MMPDEKRLKILFLPAWYPSEVNPVYGTFVKEHAKAASLHNDIVVLYAYPDPYPQRRRLCRVSEDIEDGVRTVRVKYSGIPLYLWGRITARRQESEGLPDSETKATILGKFFAVPRMIMGDLLYYWSIFSAFRKLVKLGWKPDIIHAHVYSAGVPAVLIGRLYGVPVVITEHWTGFPRHILTLSQRIRARFAMSGVRVVLPVSNFLEQAIRAYGIKAEFHVVPNVVDTGIYHPLPKQVGKDDPRKKILLVAMLTPQKGVPYLLDALAEVKQARTDFCLDIVGEGGERKKYEDLSQQLGLGDCVTFHKGFYTKKEIAELMQRCDFFIQPSLFETFGVVYIEAMACGKPVIGSDLRVLREIVDQKVGILVPPKDVKALAKAIERMLDSYQNYSPEEIAQYAGERFSYGAVGKVLDDVYREVLSDLARQNRKQRKWRAGWSRHLLEIKEDWQVLDIGSGHNPHSRADVLVDSEAGESMHRSGKPAHIDWQRPFIIADACFLPFKDKVFDYTFALHIAEHMDHPDLFCKELLRVGKRGYIETPSKLAENLLGEPFHKYFVYKKGRTLVFERKHRPTGIKWFYGLFYYGQEREGHPGITASTKRIHLFLKIAGYVTHRLWYLKPLRRLMYTRFEWKQSFDFKVKD